MMKSLLPFLPIVFALIKWIIQLYQDSMVEMAKNHAPDGLPQDEPSINSEPLINSKPASSLHEWSIPRFESKINTIKPRSSLSKNPIKTNQKKHQSNRFHSSDNNNIQNNLVEQNLNRYHHLHRSIIMHELLTPHHF